MGNRPAMWAAALIVVTALLGTGCSESEPDDGDTYYPAKVEELDHGDMKKVTLTDDAVSRIGLESATARRDGSLTVVPYAALIYDGDGDAWVYEARGGLEFVRTEVDVERVEGDLAWLSEGFTPGARVVTVGATELYGAELEIDGGH
jgi:hypothetical protein